jgi:hypothetical protein
MILDEMKLHGEMMKQKAGIALVPLDFNKIKHFFRTNVHNEVQICATLQALRWRLTRVGASMRK